MVVVEKTGEDLPTIREVRNVGVLRKQRKHMPEGFQFVEYPIDGGHVFVVVKPNSQAHSVSVVVTAPNELSRKELVETAEDIWGAFSLKAA